jgi:hypothetical protein
MKKWVVISLLFFSISLMHAQEIGARFGDISGGNVAVDAVFSTTNYSRVHGDISFGDGVGIDLLVDFVNKPFGVEAFDWYAGIGPYSFLGSPFELGLVGEIGLEYHFRGIPIAIGCDWRPFFRLIDNTDFGWGNFGFNVRLVL